MFHRSFSFHLEVAGPVPRETRKLTPYIYGPAIITEVSWNAQSPGCAFELGINGQHQNEPASLSLDSLPSFFEHFHSSAVARTAGERGDRLPGSFSVLNDGIKTIRTRLPVDLPYFTISIIWRALTSVVPNHVSGHIKVVELVPRALLERMALTDL